MRSAAAAVTLAALLATAAAGQDSQQPPDPPNLDGLLEKLEAGEPTPAKEQAPSSQPPSQEHDATEKPAPTPPTPPPDAPADPIDRTIDRAVEWLFENQKPDGGWGGDLTFCGEAHPHGLDIYGLMGLAYAGVPATDDRVQKALRLVLAAELGNWPVSHALRIKALARLHPKLKGRQQSIVRKRLQEDVAWLIERQSTSGGWAIYGNPKSSSFLITALVAAALDEAEAIVGQVPRQTWQKLLDLCVKAQLKDGGWPGVAPASPGDPPTVASASAGALMSLLIAREKLFGPPGCPCDTRNRRSRHGNRPAEAAVEQGLQWLNRGFDPDIRKVPGGDWASQWWHLWCQQTGGATGLKYFNALDWRAEITQLIVSKQLRTGDWGAGGAYWVAAHVAFLAEARRRPPPLVNKLAFDGQWNSHPADLRHLTRWLSHEKNEPLGWQAIPLEAPPDVWLEAPILYISAETPILAPDKATPDQKEQFDKTLRQKLRAFTDAGGTLVVEASCGAPAVVGWWENLAKEVWPEWKLRPIDRSRHALRSAGGPMGRLPLLLGIDDGLRTCVLFSRADISCDWNANNVNKGKAVFELGRNLYAYATDRAPLADWCRCRRLGVGHKYADQAKNLTKGPKDTLTLARVRHGDECRLGCNYRPWAHLAADLEAKVAGLALKETDPVAPGEAVPEGVDLLYLCGRTECDLGQRGAKWLTDYLAGGGFLLAEAALGDAAFDAPLRKTLAAAGLTLKPLEAGNPLVTGDMGGRARGYRISNVRFTAALDAELGPKASATSPMLYAVCDQGGKLVGLYSPWDILFSQTGCCAFDNRGYAACDARALATNIVLLLSAR